MHKGQARNFETLVLHRIRKTWLKITSQQTKKCLGSGKTRNLHNALHTTKHLKCTIWYANFGNSINGKSAGLALTGAVIGNTLIARTLGTKWLDSLDVGFMTAGLATAVAGGFTIANGIPDEDVTKLAAGGALMGLGLFYIGAGK